MSHQPDPCLPCPYCGFKIKISIEQLLFSQDFQCPGCSLKLTLDRNASQSSLELLQNLHVAMRDLELLKKQSY